MKTATFIALLLGIAVAAPVDAQTPPLVRPRAFTHQLIYMFLFPMILIFKAKCPGKM